MVTFRRATAIMLTAIAMIVPAWGCSSEPPAPPPGAEEEPTVPTVELGSSPEEGESGSDSSGSEESPDGE